MERKDNETIGLKAIIVNYLLHWKLFVFVFIITIILAVLYLSFFPRTYEMTARIQLQEDKGLGPGSSLGIGDAAGLMKSFGIGAVNGSAINLDDELVKLSSNALLEKMVLALGLNVNYYKPHAYKYRMYEETPILLQPDSIAYDRQYETLTFKISVSKDEKVNVLVKEGKKKKKHSFDSLPAVIPTEFQGSYLLTCINKEELPVSMKVDVTPSKWIAERLVDELAIEEYSKTSNIIEFFYQDYEKRRGVDMLNKLIELYNQEESNYKKDEGEKTLEFLDSRINHIMGELVVSEHDIESYKLRNKITNIEYDIQFYAEQMKELQIKIIEAEAQMHIIAILDSYVRDPKNKYNLLPPLLTSGEAEGSPVTVYNEALLERMRIMQSSLADNPLIEKINNQVDQLRESVFLSINNAKSSLTFTVDDLKKKESLILNKMETVPTLEKEYVDMKRQQEIYQAVYLLLLQKREEIALSIGENQNKARILDAAYPKENPVGPRKLYAAFGILLFTLLLPIIYLFFKEQFIDFRKAYKSAKK